MTQHILIIVFTVMSLNIGTSQGSILASYQEGEHCFTIVSSSSKVLNSIEKINYRLTPVDPFTETVTRITNYQDHFGFKEPKRGVVNSKYYQSPFFNKTNYHEFLEPDQTFISEYLEDPSNFQVDIFNSTRYESIEEDFIDTFSVVCNNTPAYSRLVIDVNHKLIELGYLDHLYKESLDGLQTGALRRFEFDQGVYGFGRLSLSTMHALGFSGYEQYAENRKKKSHYILEHTPCVVIEPDLKHHIEEVEYETIVYYGEDIEKLTYTDIITKQPIHYSFYRPESKLLTVNNNLPYRMMKKSRPEDFKARTNHMTEDEIYPGAGLLEYECVCLDDINYMDIAREAEQALSKLGYEVDNQFGNVTKKALAEFQIKTEMPIGFLDYGTLDLLGVEY